MNLSFDPKKYNKSWKMPNGDVNRIMLIPAGEGRAVYRFEIESNKSKNATNTSDPIPFDEALERWKKKENMIKEKIAKFEAEQEDEEE